MNNHISEPITSAPITATLKLSDSDQENLIFYRNETRFGSIYFARVIGTSAMHCISRSRYEAVIKDTGATESEMGSEHNGITVTTQIQHPHPDGIAWRDYDWCQDYRKAMEQESQPA